jgi:hypothetical protein
MPVDVGESTAVNESISSVAEKESPTSLYVVTISDIAPTAFSESILSDICVTFNQDNSMAGPMPCVWLFRDAEFSTPELTSIPFPNGG